MNQSGDTMHKVNNGGLMEATINKGVDLRIGKYDIIDELNDITNNVIAYMNQSGERDTILEKLKRSKELVNNL